MKLHYLRVGLLICLTTGATELPKSFGNAPLAFEPNRGQWTSSSQFGTHARGFSALFQGTDVKYVLPGGTEVKTHWLGSAPATLAAVDRLPGIANYYQGNDESLWITALPTYGKLRARGVYPGIDIVYYGNARELEYDLVVAPGADLRHISLAFEGARPWLDAKGNLVIETVAGSFVQHRPVAYQNIGSRRVPIDSHYQLGKRGEVKLAVGQYDRARELVIDPTVQWGAAIGLPNNSDGFVQSIAVDSIGNVLVAGHGTAGAFLAKYNPTGTLLFLTIVGVGSQTGLAVDSSDNVYLVGSAGPNLSTKNAYQAVFKGGRSDAFVAKFSPAGALLYATYLGGADEDYATAIAVDSIGNMYVTGNTESGDFPNVNAFQRTKPGFGPSFVTKLSADGSSLLFSTFLAGSNGSNTTGIAVGADSSVYLSGHSYSYDFPTTKAFQVGIRDRLAFSPFAFVTRLAASGSSLLYSSVFSGATDSQGTIGLGLDVDAGGSAYLTGYTYGGFPVIGGGFQNAIGSSGYTDAFLLKLLPDGNSMAYFTYLGGSLDDFGIAVRVDPSGSATVVGSSGSPDFPTVSAFRPQQVRGDGFVTKFSPTGDAVIYSSFLGGNGSDDAEAVALDSAGNVYVGGSTTSTDFPATVVTRRVSTPYVVKISANTAPPVPATFTTIPSGLQVTVDGATRTTPITLQWAPGVTHQLDVPMPQTIDGANAAFASWSNAGTKSQSLTTPTSASTYTATLSTHTCTYTLGPPSSATFGRAGGSSLLVITSPAGCPWTATSNAPWIIVPGDASGSGSGTASYKVIANPTVTARTGAITIGTTTFNVTQILSAPTVTYVNPTGPTSGFTQTFLYEVNDLDGTGDLAISNLLINNFLDGRQACYLAYDHGLNILYLVKDDGATLSPPLPFDASGRSTGSISNSQCTVNGTQSFISRAASPTKATLNLSLTFAPTFAGNKILYAAARDQEELNSGWSVAGLWNVPGTTTYPNVVTSTISTTSVSVTYQDATNNTNLTPSQILINGALDGRLACYMGYDHRNNYLYLVDDAGGSLLAPITPGVGTGTQQNSQCMISAQGSTVMANGTNYTLNVKVAFLGGFKGLKLVYAASQTTTGTNSGWQAVNTLMIP